MTHRILVATDLGTAAGHALERVLRLAERRRDLEIHVLQVCMPGDSEARAKAALADHLHERVDAARVLVPHVRTAPSIVGGIRHAAAEIGASTVAVGSRGGQLLGAGIAEGLLDQLSVDLLVVHRDRHAAQPAHRGRVIVGVDFSDVSRRAIAAAAPFRGEHELGLVHVVDTDPHALPRVPRPEPDAMFESLQARLREWAGAVPARAFVERGEIGSTLAAVAEREEAALIVVGARGVRDGAAPLANTAAARLVRSARAPVLVVR